MSFGDARLPERFWAKVIPEPNTGCWLWLGGLVDGYGLVGKGGARVLTHRWAYEVFVGEIPKGLQLDHLCRTRSCCNPGHLEPVTNAENTRRGIAGDVNGGRQRAKTHCRAGHPYDGDNLLLYRTPSGALGRRCRACHNAQARASWRGRP